MEERGMTTCPFCNNPHSGRTGGMVPEDGDITLCYKCGELGIFDEATDGGVRKPFEDEISFFDRNEGIQILRAAWRRNRQ
jgi:hypothetical protein